VGWKMSRCEVGGGGANGSNQESKFDFVA